MRDPRKWSVVVLFMVVCVALAAAGTASATRIETESGKQAPAYQAATWVTVSESCPAGGCPVGDTDTYESIPNSRWATVNHDAFPGCYDSRSCPYFIHYDPGPSSPYYEWRAPGYDDTSWPNSGYVTWTGYWDSWDYIDYQSRYAWRAASGDNNNGVTNLFRAHFTIPDGYTVLDARITKFSDNDTAIWVNGQEVSGRHGGGEVTLHFDPSVVHAGTNVLAIQLSNDHVCWPDCNPLGMQYTLEVRLVEPTPTPTNTPTPTSTPTSTNTPTPTNTPTATRTPTNTPTPTPTSTPTSTNMPTATPTNTPTNTPTPTATATPYVRSPEVESYVHVDASVFAVGSDPAEVDVNRYAAIPIQVLGRFVPAAEIVREAEYFPPPPTPQPGADDIVTHLVQYQVTDIERLIEPTWQLASPLPPVSYRSAPPDATWPRTEDSWAALPFTPDEYFYMYPPLPAISETDCVEVVTTSPKPAGTNPETRCVTIDPLPPGFYRVTWQLYMQTRFDLQDYGKGYQYVSWWQAPFNYLPEYEFIVSVVDEQELP